VEKQNRKEIQANYKSRKVIGGICAMKNTVNGKQLVIFTADLQGRKNRFEFSKKSNTCADLKLKDDFKSFGADTFVFEVLEELKKSDAQSDKEFSDDLKALYELWLEKIDPKTLY
jgi:hypothetical protein